MAKSIFINFITAGLILLLTLGFSITTAADQQLVDSKLDNKIEESCLNKQEIIKPEIAEKIIKDRAAEVIQLIDSKKFDKLADYVHPEKGLRFTPYTYVKKSDVVFTKKQLSDFFEDDKKYLWGHYDGSGKEIRLTPEEYYHEFIYSENFINAEEVGYNEVLSSGNMLENQFEVYENPIIVEYYYSGFEPKFEGMDWKSLRLVFEEHQNKWKLTGIIHNQWTI